MNWVTEQNETRQQPRPTALLVSRAGSLFLHGISFYFSWGFSFFMGVPPIPPPLQNWYHKNPFLYYIIHSLPHIHSFLSFIDFSYALILVLFCTKVICFVIQLHRICSLLFTPSNGGAASFSC